MRSSSALIALFASLACTLSAQVRYRPAETGPWRPWSFTAVAAARQQRSASPAEVQAFEKRLLELAAIVRRAPAVSPPIGFAGEMWGNLNSYSTAQPGRPAGKTVPLAGALTFAAFPLVESMGAAVPLSEHDGSGSASIATNARRTTDVSAMLAITAGSGPGMGRWSGI